MFWRTDRLYSCLFDGGCLTRSDHLCTVWQIPRSDARIPQTFVALQLRILLGRFRPQMTWPCKSVTGQIVSCKVFRLFICMSLGWYGSQSKSTCYVAIGFLPCSPDEMLKMSMRLWFYLRFTVSMLRPSCELMLPFHWGYHCAFDGRPTETKSHNVRILKRFPGGHKLTLSSSYCWAST